MLAQILQYRRFIKRGGVTFSGGEPLMQPEFVAALSALLHLENVHVALDTSGCQPLALSKKALDASDLVLLDIKATDPQMCLKMTGMDNTNAFETLDYLERIQKPVWIRHVLLRGYTLDKAQLALLARKLQNYGCIQKVELLPFHKLGEVKWEMMDRPYMLKDIPATTRQELDEAKAFFAREGFSVQ